MAKRKPKEIPPEFAINALDIDPALYTEEPKKKKRSNREPAVPSPPKKRLIDED